MRIKFEPAACGRANGFACKSLSVSLSGHCANCAGSWHSALARVHLKRAFILLYWGRMHKCQITLLAARRKLLALFRDKEKRTSRERQLSAKRLARAGSNWKWFYATARETFDLLLHWCIWLHSHQPEQISLMWTNSKWGAAPANCPVFFDAVSEIKRDESKLTIYTKSSSKALVKR